MKKQITTLCIIVLCTFSLAGCSQKQKEKEIQKVTGVTTEAAATPAAKRSNSSGSYTPRKSYSSSSSNSSGSGGYSYNKSDPYYSKNDHDGDGRINDQEFQDAMGDAINDLLAASGY